MNEAPKNVDKTVIETEGIREIRLVRERVKKAYEKLIPITKPLKAKIFISLLPITGKNEDFYGNLIDDVIMLFLEDPNKEIIEKSGNREFKTTSIDLSLNLFRGGILGYAREKKANGDTSGIEDATRDLKNFLENLKKGLNK